MIASTLKLKRVKAIFVPSNNCYQTGFPNILQSTCAAYTAQCALKTAY